MNKADDVFYNIAEQIKQQGKIQANEVQNVCIGLVTSTDPILVEYNGLQLDTEDNLTINETLLKGYKDDRLRILINGMADSTTIVFENTRDKFSVGDRVLMLTQDNQSFYVACVLK